MAKRLKEKGVRVGMCGYVWVCMGVYVDEWRGEGWGVSGCDDGRTRQKQKNMLGRG